MLHVCKDSLQLCPDQTLICCCSEPFHTSLVAQAMSSSIQPMLWYDCHRLFAFVAEAAQRVWCRAKCAKVGSECRNYLMYPE